MSIKSFTTGSGPLTKIRAEQVKAEIVTGGTLASDLLGIKEQIAAIAGSAFDTDYALDYSKVQLHDLSGHLDAASSASELEVLQALKVRGAARVVGAAEIDGAVKMNSTLSLTGSAELKSSMSVAGAADFNGGITANEIKLDGDGSAAGNLYLVGAGGIIADEAKLAFNGSKLSITGGIDASGEMKAGTIAMTGFSVDASGNMAAASVKDASLTAGRVVFAGTAGDLSDDADFAFASDVLTV